jgi:hypothetical protein
MIETLLVNFPGADLEIKIVLPIPFRRGDLPVRNSIPLPGKAPSATQSKVMQQPENDF